VLAALAALGVICTACALIVFLALIREVGTSRAMTFTYVNPAIAVAAGVALLGEPFTKLIAASFVLILGGCLLATSSRREQASPADPAAQPSLAAHADAAAQEVEVAQDAAVAQDAEAAQGGKIAPTGGEESSHDLRPPRASGALWGGWYGWAAGRPTRAGRASSGPCYWRAPGGMQG
jgi:hypothetical protein